jgi:hypothetical protein
MKCEMCGNEYDKSFTVVLHDGDEHVYDSFECAIHALAPICAHCDCRIIGHGIEAPGQTMYCCAHCAQQGGASQAKDRIR